MKKNDMQKCLDTLRRHGSEGIHSFYLGHIVGSTRVAARILDLKHQGYNITSIPEKMGDAIGVRYFLHETVSTQSEKDQNKPRAIKYEFVGNMAIPVIGAES